MAAMLGLSGDFIGTLDGSAWYQRGWMIAVALVLFGAHIGVEMLNTREDRLKDIRLEEALDRLKETEERVDGLNRERAELGEAVTTLRAQEHLLKQQVSERAREQSGLDWLAGEQGRAVLEGLRDFAERLHLAHRAADSAGAAPPPRAAEDRPRAAEDRVPLRGVVPRVALQLAAGLIAALAFGFAVYVIEVYFD
ncbi:hypothetical protein ACFPZ0_00300 [Streptomonospora nanhaiensis]|uniref:Cell division protein FtsB n=1 Tax=Streptomonospora nanhaiensis TaxID=1323731 RepID=A0A853BKS9_9ACTN|nr:hypothetical protein [Streptomonospora nanhaiensis]MBV2364192.1 hypothetical protein [Streptomonospora nanhaiensis]MBX9386688.1 hypothetical protein [Streptomonospora nanhaiensis]NYI95146.1 cell division protein FtsB [Streptomonospora nanhaiensis]